MLCPTQNSLHAWNECLCTDACVIPKKLFRTLYMTLRFIYIYSTVYAVGTQTLGSGYSMSPEVSRE